MSATTSTTTSSEYRNPQARAVADGSLRVALPPAEALHFFTPLGETEWVDGWAPNMIHPQDGKLEEDQVFVTDHGDEITIWSVIRVDRERHEVEYLRVTPGSRLARVSVALRREGEAASRVHMRYTLTALAPAGEPVIRDLVDNYDRLMATWQQTLERHLATRSVA